MDDLETRELLLRLARSICDVGLARIRCERAMRDTTAAFDRFGMAWTASELAEGDLGEFDNRTHDWLRAG